jgi:uncharacterized protein YdhG (YjbR/CyaY superfamily)
MADRPPKDFDAYVAPQPRQVRAILRKIRATIRQAAPGADEVISYQMPAFKLDGRILIYFAGFKQHIGIYPPVRGDQRLMKDLKRYANEKGNLRLPLDEPIPYDLIKRIIEARTIELADRPRSRGRSRTRG